MSTEPEMTTREDRSPWHASEAVAPCSVYVSTPRRRVRATGPFSVRTGARVSTTVTGKEQLAALPTPSVAEQPTVFEPRENTVPEAGEHTVLTPPQASWAEGAKLATAPPALHSSAGTAGHTSVGAVSSSTVTVASHEAVAPFESVQVSFTACVPFA